MSQLKPISPSLPRTVNYLLDEQSNLPVRLSDLNYDLVPYRGAQSAIVISNPEKTTPSPLAQLIVPPILQALIGIVIMFILLALGYKITSVSSGSTLFNYSSPDSSSSGSPDMLNSSDFAQPQLQAPDNFIRYYLGSVTQETNRQSLWGFTAGRKKSVTSREYKDYVNYWRSVSYLQIESNTCTQQGYTARCRVAMTMLKNNRSSRVNKYYHLTYDASLRSWVLDSSQ